MTNTRPFLPQKQLTAAVLSAAHLRTLPHIIPGRSASCKLFFALAFRRFGDSRNDFPLSWGLAE